MVFGFSQRRIARHQYFRTIGAHQGANPRNRGIRGICGDTLGTIACIAIAGNRACFTCDRSFASSIISPAFGCVRGSRGRRKGTYRNYTKRYDRACCYDTTGDSYYNTCNYCCNSKHYTKICRPILGLCPTVWNHDLALGKASRDTTAARTGLRRTAGLSAGGG